MGSRVGNIRIDRSGVMTGTDAAGRDVLGEMPGVYKAVRADSLVLLALDEGTGAAVQEGESLALAGSLKTNSLLGLLNLLSQNRDTGRLVLKHEANERVIILKDGDIASVGSNAPDDRLGKYLHRLGRISEAQLDAAEAEASARHTRIGQVLVAQNVLDPHELWSCIQQQITEIFSDVVQWEDGSFVLYRVAEGFRFPSTPPMSMQSLLLEAVRRADEMGVFRERIPDRRTFLKPTGKALKDSAEDLDKNALEIIGDGATIADVVRGLHVTEFEATRACYNLLKAKAVEIVDVEQPAKAIELTGDQRARLDVYNLAFREIKDEVLRAGVADAFLDGAQKYLADASGPHATIFAGVTLDNSGALPVEPLVRNLSGISTAEPMSLLQEALNELTFFMLFQCGELLDPTSDENLGRRVRLIHAALTQRR
jgi:hypothetical protein